MEHLKESSTTVTHHCQQSAACLDSKSDQKCLSDEHKSERSNESYDSLADCSRRAHKTSSCNDNYPQDEEE